MKCAALYLSNNMILVNITHQAIFLVFTDIFIRNKTASELAKNIIFNKTNDVNHNTLIPRQTC